LQILCNFGTPWPSIGWHYRLLLGRYVSWHIGWLLVAISVNISTDLSVNTWLICQLVSKPVYWLTLGRISAKCLFITYLMQTVINAYLVSPCNKHVLYYGTSLVLQYPISAKISALQNQLRLMNTINLLWNVKNTGYLNISYIHVACTSMQTM